MHHPASLLQRKCGACEAEHEDTLLGREALQMKGARENVPPVTPEVQRKISSLRGGGEPLPPNVRSFFEPRFGHDFSQVRIHTEGGAAESAQRINAVAYTLGHDIVFQTGRYEPETVAGKELLAHELTHVIQQGRVQPTSAAHQTSPITISRLENPSRLARMMDVDEEVENEETDEGQQPQDMAHSQAAEVGEDALETVGYDEIIRLAIKAGFLTPGSGGEGTSNGAERIQRQAVAPAAAAGAVTFGGVFTRYAIAAGIASQVDSPAPGPGDVVALGILAVGLVAAGWAVLSSSTTTTAVPPTTATTAVPTTGVTIAPPITATRSRPNQTCDDARLAVLTLAKAAACLGPFTCSDASERIGRRDQSLLSCAQLLANIAAINACLAARNLIQSECFTGNPEPGHDAQIAQLTSALATCMAKRLARGC